MITGQTEMNSPCPTSTNFRNIVETQSKYKTNQTKAKKSSPSEDYPRRRCDELKSSI